MNIDIIKRYYTICNTLHDMFRDRGYSVSPSFSISFDNFFQLYMSEPHMFGFPVTKSFKKKTSLFVFFPKKVKTGVKELREIVQSMEDLEIKHAIIILKQNITPFAANRLRTFPNIYIEQFEMQELMFNVTKHLLVPPHRLLTKLETKDLLKRLHSQSTSILSKIQKNDPLCRYFNAHIGRVFEITRSSPEGHNYKAYRVVVRSTK